MALHFLSPIHKAIRQITLHLEEQMSGLPVTPQEAHLLTYLLAYAPCPMSELARVFGLKRSTLTSMLDRLEGRSILVRSVNPDDRRSFMVELSRGGKKLAREVSGMVTELERQIDRRVTPGDRRGFDAVMAAIAAVTEVEVRPQRPARKETMR
jgi:DNA-binding MarR family transcriptional regulator